MSMTVNKNNIKGSIILSTAALIWGLAFVAQSGLTDKVPPFMCNALRSIIAAAFLLVFWAITNSKEKKPFFDTEKRKDYLLGGIICGICLAISVNFQQFGIAAYESQGANSEARAGFLTVLYVIMVPLISVFMKKKITLPVWLGVIIALLGIYMLCFSGGISGIYLGDLLVLFCAFTFSLHIIAVDKYVGIIGGVKLSVMQFFVCAAISFIMSAFFEGSEVSMSGIVSALPQVLYLGIMSSGIAYTLQVIGQKFAEPTVASISMSLESVFAALGGWIISKNALSMRELLGCGLVFAAIIIAQLPDFKRKPNIN